MLSTHNERRTHRTALVVVSVLALVVVAAVWNNSSAMSPDKNVALVSNKLKTTGATGFDETDPRIWELDEEETFRKELAAVTSERRESKFVDRLVSEWKLRKESGAVVGKDGYLVVNKFECSPPLGGNGGTYFGYINSGLGFPGMTAVCVRSGGLVDQVSIGFRSGVVLTRGGNGGVHACFHVLNGCVNRINIRTGNVVDGIQFITTAGVHSAWFGGHGGTFHQVAGAAGTCLRGVLGRAGGLVDNLQFCFA